MSKSLSRNMPSFATPVPETPIHSQNMPVEDSSVANSNPTVDVKKIVLLKRNPNNVTDNNSTQSGAGSSTLISSIDLMQTPSRSGSSSPNLEVELTPEQSAHLGEIDFNTGLDGFLLAALKNPKDRLFLLKLDREMERFINEKNHTRLEFPPMNSYQRLIVHRVAQYFKLSHVVDSSGKAVVLYKSSDTQIPILRFSDLLEQEEEKPEKSVKIMRRQQINAQSQLRSTGDSDSNSEGERKILTIEEREAAYQKARARIFKDLEQKNEENEQDENEESVSSSPNTKHSNISNNNDQQNSDLTSSNKSKGAQQTKSANANNNKNNKQSQQTNKTVGNNKNSTNKTSVNTVKNRQQQTQRLQTINFNLPIDRSFYMSKQPRPVGNFPGPPPMMPPGPFGPPFFGGPHLNMYDVNMLPIQPPMLPPEMHHMGNPYMNVPHEWNPTLAGPYGRPNVRNVWGESFNAPPEMGGGPSLFNQQPNTGNSFLPRPTQQNDTNFASTQGHNPLKYMNQHPQTTSFGETNHVVNSSASTADGNSNKLTSARDGTTSPNSPISQTGFENNNSLWTKNQWGNMTSGEGTSENKSNDQQSDQKRTNNRPSTFVPTPQQREGPVILQFAQASAEFSSQNTSGLPMMHPHMYPGFVPTPISGPASGPRRNNNGNQMFPGPVPPEHVSLPRMNMIPPPIMGFPQQPASLTGAIRPPKSSELFDPNHSIQSSNIATSASDSISPTSVQPSSGTLTLVPLPSRHSPPVTSSKGSSISNNKTTATSCAGVPTGTKVINQNHVNTRRKNNGNDTSTNANHNSVVNGTMMRSLSLSSNHSQGKNQSNHHRASSTSPSGNNKKKEGGLLFDYSMQVPYEGVKPSEANEPPQPNHIIELYDFAESDDLIDITFANATIKMIFPPQNLPTKRPTILAIFKTSREANKAMQNFRGVRFKIKTWEPLVKNNGSNITLSNVVD
ncbi:8836_t:CDS:2 [Cetraspora pellucida]|uniref:8836_t:CDS:1 n=1 Tax=Cetraspora pellucida TaxID=1433469 RepID=A0A9N9AMU7_9GLOM|nr:8836_t:CDS:2 [Cetraspora pellucida]